MEKKYRETWGHNYWCSSLDVMLRMGPNGWRTLLRGRTRALAVQALFVAGMSLGLLEFVCAKPSLSSTSVDAMVQLRPRGTRHWLGASLDSPLTPSQKGLRMLLGGAGMPVALREADAESRVDDASVVLIADNHESPLTKVATLRLVQRFREEHPEHELILLLESIPCELQPAADKILRGGGRLESMDEMLLAWWGRPLPGFQELLVGLSRVSPTIRVVASGPARRARVQGGGIASRIRSARADVETVLKRSVVEIRGSSPDAKIWILVGEWHVIGASSFPTDLEIEQREKVVSIVALEVDWELAIRLHRPQGSDWFEPIPDIFRPPLFSATEIVKEGLRRSRTSRRQRYEARARALGAELDTASLERKKHIVKELALMSPRSGIAERVLLGLAAEPQLRVDVVNWLRHTVEFWQTGSLRLLREIARTNEMDYSLRLSASIGLGHCLAYSQAALPVLLEALDRPSVSRSDRKEIVFILAALGNLARPATGRLKIMVATGELVSEARGALRAILDPPVYQGR